MVLDFFSCELFVSLLWSLNVSWLVLALRLNKFWVLFQGFLTSCSGVRFETKNSSVKCLCDLVGEGGLRKFLILKFIYNFKHIS